MKKGKHDYSTLLIFAAALVTVVRYSAAFIASDMGEITGWLSDGITILMGVSGLGMGILDTFGGVYLFDGWRHTMPAAGKAWSFRFKILTGFVFALIVTGIMILVPFTESRVTHKSMDGILGTGAGLTWWSVLVNAAPYLLIGGVTVGNSLIATNQGGKLPENSDTKKENSGNFETAKPRWNRVTIEEYEWIAAARTGEIQTRYGLDERTARNWRVKAQKSR
jgi:hypothetical protein